MLVTVVIEIEPNKAVEPNSFSVFVVCLLNRRTKMNTSDLNQEFSDFYCSHYITLEDHKSVIAECKRLLGHLKWNYERSLAKKTSDYKKLKRKLAKVIKQRDIYKIQSRNLLQNVIIKKQRIHFLEKERYKALHCLNDVLNIQNGCNVRQMKRPQNDKNQGKHKRKARTFLSKYEV